jgi:hypothetical protein
MKNEKWSELGYLKNWDSTKKTPKLAQWDNPQSGTLHEPTMAYLDINCAHYYNPTVAVGVHWVSISWQQNLWA